MYNITNILFDFPVDSMEHIVKKQMEENNKKTCNIRNKNLKKRKNTCKPAWLYKYIYTSYLLLLKKKIDYYIIN